MRKRDELADPNSCLNKAGDDEILFVLIERDAATPGTIRDWIKRRIELGLNKPGDAKLVRAEGWAQLIESRHAERCEPADLTPMKNDKPYITDPDKVLHALLLTDAGTSRDKPLGPPDDEMLEAAIAGWTDDQRAAAFEWAALSHLHASDNDDVEVPPCPPHVEELRPSTPTNPAACGREG